MEKIHNSLHTFHNFSTLRGFSRQTKPHSCVFFHKSPIPRPIHTSAGERLPRVRQTETRSTANGNAEYGKRKRGMRRKQTAPKAPPGPCREPGEMPRRRHPGVLGTVFDRYLCERLINPTLITDFRLTKKRVNLKKLVKSKQSCLCLFVVVLLPVASWQSGQRHGRKTETTPETTRRHTDCRERPKKSKHTNTIKTVPSLSIRGNGFFVFLRAVQPRYQ